MKYYKILRSDMTHHGFVYKEGLNIDTEPFDETPNYGGGLFFCDKEHILGFCDYGNLIAEVEIPIGEKVIKVDNQYKAHAIILKNIKPLWNPNTLAYLVKKGVNIHIDDDFLFKIASTNGHLETIQYMIDNGTNVHAYDEWALITASGAGHLEMIKYLLNKGADIHADDDDAYCYAAENGHIEVVKYLIYKGANIHAHNDWAFRYGTKEIKEYLTSLQK